MFSLTTKLILKVVPLEHATDTIVLRDNFARIEESFLQGGAPLGAYLYPFGV